MRPQSNVEGTIEFSAYGDALINGSFDFGVLLDKETDAKKYSSRFASRMFYIKKIAD